MSEKKQKAITSKTIKNMMSQLSTEAYSEVERVYGDWINSAQSIAPMIDSFSSASLKRLVKSAIVPEFQLSELSPKEKKASDLLEEIMNLRIELFIVSAFINKPKKEDGDAVSKD